MQEQARVSYHNGGVKEKAAEYYKNNKKRLHESAINKHRNLSEKKSGKNRERRNQYRNMSEEDKLKLKFYQKEQKK